ncbi:unnamed protein product, partial [Leptidea sinapis]
PLVVSVCGVGWPRDAPSPRLLPLPAVASPPRPPRALLYTHNYLAVVSTSGFRGVYGCVRAPEDRASASGTRLCGCSEAYVR